MPDFSFRKFTLVAVWKKDGLGETGDEEIGVYCRNAGKS